MTSERVLPLLTSDWGRRSGWASVIILALWMLMSCVDSLKTWYGDAMLLHSSTVSRPADASVDHMAQMIADIPHQHVFGQTLDQDNVASITSMPIKLTGIVVSSNNVSPSKAIISESGQPGKIYEVGDTLPSGIKVYAIHENDVVFENAGRLEKLPMQRSRLEFHGMPTPLLQSTN